MKLSLSDSYVLKGIAILLLLTDHLFYKGQPYDDILISGHGVIENFSEISKCCVAIFVFLSGYGLTASSTQRGIGNILSFYYKRYIKLMLNYWLIWLIFVPLGIFVFDRTFEVVYSEQIIYKSVADFFGLHFAITRDYLGYNATWWFYSCIIMLYLLFPFLYKFRKQWHILIPASIIFYSYGDIVPLFHACHRYLPTFLIGILIYDIKEIPTFSNNNYKNMIITFICFLIICIFRLIFNEERLWDVIIVTFGVILYKVINIPQQIQKSLHFLGKHSFNIFLFHTFFHFYYFPTFIYWSRNPLLIFSTLLSTSIIVSLLLEKIKDLIGMSKLEGYLLKMKFI